MLFEAKHSLYGNTAKSSTYSGDSTDPKDSADSENSTDSEKLAPHSKIITSNIPYYNVLYNPKFAPIELPEYEEPPKTEEEAQERKLLEEEVLRNQEFREKLQKKGEETEKSLRNKIAKSEAANQKAGCEDFSHTIDIYMRLFVEISGEKSLFTNDTKDKKVHSLNGVRCLNLPDAMRELIKKISDNSKGDPRAKLSEMTKLMIASTYLYHHLCCKPASYKVGAIPVDMQHRMLHPDYNRYLYEPSDPMVKYFPDEYNESMNRLAESSCNIMTQLLKGKLNSTESLGVVVEEFTRAYNQIGSSDPKKAKEIIIKVFEEQCIFEETHATSKVVQSDFIPLYVYITEIQLRLFKSLATTFDSDWYKYKPNEAKNPSDDEIAKKKNDCEARYEKFSHSLDRLKDILYGAYIAQQKERDVLVKESVEMNLEAYSAPSLGSLPINNLLTKPKEPRMKFHGLERQPDLFTCSTLSITRENGSVVLTEHTKDGQLTPRGAQKRINNEHTQSKNVLKEYVELIKRETGESSITISFDAFCLALMHMISDQCPAFGSREVADNQALGMEIAELSHSITGTNTEHQLFRILRSLSHESENFIPKLVSIELQRFKTEIGEELAAKITPLIKPIAAELSIELFPKITKEASDITSIQEISDQDLEKRNDNSKISPEKKVLSPKERAQLAGMIENLLGLIIVHVGLEKTRQAIKTSIQEEDPATALKKEVMRARGPGKELSEQDKQAIKLLGESNRQALEFVRQEANRQGTDLEPAIAVLNEEIFQVLLAEIVPPSEEMSGNLDNKNRELNGEQINWITKFLVNNQTHPIFSKLLKNYNKESDECSPDSVSIHRLQETNNYIMSSQDSLADNINSQGFSTLPIEAQLILVRDWIIQRQMPGISWSTLNHAGSSFEALASELMQLEIPGMQQHVDKLMRQKRKKYSEERNKLQEKGGGDEAEKKALQNKFYYLQEEARIELGKFTSEKAKGAELRGESKEEFLTKANQSIIKVEDENQKAITESESSRASRKAIEGAEASSKKRVRHNNDKIDDTTPRNSRTQLKPSEQQPRSILKRKDVVVVTQRRDETGEAPSHAILSDTLSVRGPSSEVKHTPRE